jgi:hypothetical protein
VHHHAQLVTSLLKAHHVKQLGKYHNVSNEEIPFYILIFYHSLKKLDKARDNILFAKYGPMTQANFKQARMRL